MKKLLLSLLCVILAFSLMACGGKKEPATDPTNAPSGQESTNATENNDSTTEGGEDATTEGGEDATTEGNEDATTGKNTDATAGKDTDATTGKDGSTTADKDTTTGKTSTSATTTAKTETTTKTDKTTKPTGSTKPTKTTAAPSDNVVNWEDVFGTDPTKATTTKKGETTTTTTTTTTASTTTTTVPPTVAEKVLLPAVGTDVDVVKQKGRIRISAIDLKNGKLTVSIKNESTGWITEETDYVKYACYDKDGKELKGTGDFYGYFYLGCLEVGDVETFTVNLPAGTAEVKLVDSKIVYWTEWA